MTSTNVPDFSLSDDSKYVIKKILESKTATTGGILDVDELGDCLEAFGFDADDEDIEFLKKHFDDNGDGELEVKELMDNIDVINWHCFHGKELMREFTKIDTDGDGVIRYPEMLRVLTTRGPNPLGAMEGRKLLDFLARKYDANFDGKFSYAEFVKIYMSDALPYKDTLGQGHSSDDEEQKQDTAGAKSAAKKPVKRASGPTKKKSSTLNGASAATTTTKTPPKSPSTATTSSGSHSKGGAANTSHSKGGAASTSHSKGGASSTASTSSTRKKIASSSTRGQQPQTQKTRAVSSKSPTKSSNGKTN